MKKLYILTITIFFVLNVFSVPKTKTWTGVIVEIDEYLQQNADDYKSIEFVSAGYIIEFEGGLITQRVKFRAKNKFGAYVLNDWFFTMTYNGANAKIVSIDKIDDVKKLINTGKLKIKAEYDRDGGRIYNKDLWKL